MPNHVINEIIFRDCDEQLQRDILAAVLTDGEVDFGVLLPKPLNIWMGSCGRKHEQAFRVTGLDWATANWGTKWNAYGHNEGGKYRSVRQDGTSLILTFQTAWRPPYGWIVALFNRFKISFDHDVSSVDIFWRDGQTFSTIQDAADINVALAKYNGDRPPAWRRTLSDVERFEVVPDGQMTQFGRLVAEE
jgi:hypothetical protein